MANSASARAAAAAGRLRIFPDDARQALRLRRFIVAAATSALLPLLLAAMAGLGYVDAAPALWSAALVGAFAVLFFVLFRAGLNLRFADPSLTGEQILAAILTTAYVSYHAGEARPAVAMFYLVALFFGSLRLGASRLFGLAGIALLAHAVVIWAWHKHNPAADMTGSLVDLAALAVVLPWLAGMAAYVNGMRARLSDSHRRLQDAYDRIEKIAIRDELTGAYNRRFLMEALAREQARAKRRGNTYSVCLFDVDHFKRINDSWGHAAGDTALKHFAAIAGADLRDVDIFGRYGGEEFLLILPDTAQRGAAAAAERGRAGVLAAGFPQVPSEHRVTVTAGVATSRAEESVDALLARADRGLYEGKTAGRNRVVVVG
jgi:diguanylate cyclase (GGDEF)-like protein